MASYPDTHGTDRTVMKAVTVSLMKWGVNPPLIAGIFLVHILSQWQFPVRAPFQHQPPAVPALARRWPHHIVAPTDITVDWPQVWRMSVLSYWIFGTFFSMNFAPKYFFCFSDSCVAGGKVVRTVHVPMGGWAENNQATPRHHEPVPEESSEDEMPPHIHKVNVLYWSF